MIISSKAFSDGGKIPLKFTCDGENISPPLEFIEVPPKTESLCLIVEDPDSPQPNFTHWVIFNISKYTQEFFEDITTEKMNAGVNDFGNTGYGGPCPGKGIHRYVFKLYALDAKINLEDGATKGEVLEGMKDKILASAELTGLYSR